MSDLLSRPPTKIVAVHVSYRSRALQRGVLPSSPSYFLKPPSGLAASGEPIERPPGCGLLAFEGEVALVIGTRASRVEREAAWSHVAWVTAANDFAVYDLRYADRGGNVRSKGIDRLTPLGPRLLDARSVDPATLRVRTWRNGILAQDARAGEELLFGFDDMIADLTRLMTLEPGDVILTGTPAGSTVVGPGDLVEVEVTAGEASTGRLRSPIIEAGYSLAQVGAMPKMTDEARHAAFGTNGQSDHVPAGLSAPALAGFAQVSTATLASQLRRRGLNGCTMDGLRTTRPDRRMAGFARTLRYLPLREDLSARYGSGMNAQKQAIEQIRPGEVLVVDARREPTAGTIGDILALRAQTRGAVGIVTDGAIRDAARLAELDIPTYHAAVHPAVLGRRHVPWECGVTVACAGVTVQPGDLVVGDSDGVVVIPPPIAAELLADALEQEQQEEFIAIQVAAGERIEGLYPLSDRWQPAYQAWLAEREPAAETEREPALEAAREPGPEAEPEPVLDAESEPGREAERTP
jgi:regulator of RNase E activity RraA/2-keto-4-pentenoate hydratase/2-oxohepta-3-ene-1,7-dioic acid hydratase in catechol pathway